ncbi:MAG: tetratricopeptide repeat protein [Planctomycetes bacterium]|nr:tetratricopeptide repeat protein [Planctomycetota bacterium]
MTPARTTSWWLSTAAILALTGCSFQMPWSTAPTEAGRANITRLVSRARLHERHGQSELAERIYRQVRLKDPKNQLVVHRLAVVAARGRHYAESQRLFHDALKLGPPNAELLSDYGYCLYLQDDLPAAERVLRDALKLDPQHTGAHAKLAVTLGEQERFDEALAEFRQSVGEAEALANLGYMQSQLGYYDEAQANLDRALTLNPDLRPAAEALVQLAQAQRKIPARESSPPGRVRRAIAREKPSNPRGANSVRLTAHNAAVRPARNRPHEERIARLPRVRPKTEVTPNRSTTTRDLPWRPTATQQKSPRLPANQLPEMGRPASRPSLGQQQKATPPPARLRRASTMPADTDRAATRDSDQNLADGRFQWSRRPARSGMISSPQAAAARSSESQVAYPWQPMGRQSGDYSAK